MNIDTIIKKKEILEGDIADLINKFQNETRCKILSIEHNNMDITSLGDSRNKYKTHISLSIGVG